MYTLKLSFQFFNNSQRAFLIKKNWPEIVPFNSIMFPKPQHKL